MRGVSEVISIILILMITIAISGLAYTFMSATMSETTSAASSAVTTTTSSMLTSFTIESMDIAKVYVRNTGQTTLSNLSVYVNDVPAIYNITPTSITSGQVGTITIYSFIPDGATVKITSPSGFSTSKIADECTKAVGCWKFDEGTGAIAYDSSPYGNTGTLTNMNITGNATSGWTTGRYGIGLQFDDTNDYVAFSSVVLTGEYSISYWSYRNSNNTYDFVLGHISLSGKFGFDRGNNNLFIRSNDTNGGGVTAVSSPVGQWVYIAVVRNSSYILKAYVNGVENLLFNGVIQPGSLTLNRIGIDAGSWVFNGTIDEVRIYSKAIY